MNKLLPAIITGFEIIASRRGDLGIVVTVEHSGAITQSTAWEKIAPTQLHDRILGLLRVAGVESTDRLIDAEVRVEIRNGFITAIGHVSQARYWQSNYLRLVA